MTVRREDGQGMRHSSSWPDRSQRTVRVRVDPLSRAFTIVPTSRSSEEEEEKPKIFGKSLTHDVTIDDKTQKKEKEKEKEAEEEEEVIIVKEEKKEKEEEEKEDNVNPRVEIDRKSRPHREFQRKTLHSSLRALNRHRLYVETSSLSSTISTGRASRRRRSNSSIELKIFDVAPIGLKDDVKEKKEGTLLADSSSHSVREGKGDGKEEEYEEKSEKEKIIEKRETSKPTVVLTPHIEIVDYDRIGGTTSSSQSDRHACPKCTSEGQLRLQVDPFRSPIAYDASNGSINGPRTRPQSILSKKRREIDRSNACGRSTWPDGRTTSFATGYLAKRELTLGKKKRNGLSNANQQTCRPTYDLCKEATLRRHYYPEGGWGYVIVTCSMLVHFLGIGLQFAAPGTWHLTAQLKFHHPPLHSAGWLGAMSTGVALLVSPVTIAFCRRKSTRVTAVLGGLVTALGCLFTSFASQFHQLFFSYGTMVGIGVSMTRDCSTLMVAQYFKRRRELVEIFIVSGSGLGIAVMSAFIKGAISKIGWRLGLQAVTGVVFLTFILGTFYRSASLYHPQRRAILHLKNQKRKIKDKNKTDDRPAFFDFSTLKSKTVRILLVSTGISAFGINTPIFYLAHQAEEEGLGDTVVLLQAYLGLAWTLGCVAFGLLVVHRNVECRIARQYLTQAAVFVCGLCILALTAVQGNYHGYVMFTWIYGIFCGGYHYSLKMYTYERVRARNFARTWGFVQCSQAIPIAIGVPISGYINVGCGGKAGYYFSSTCVLVGSFTLFFIDLHRRNLSKHKHTRANGSKHLCVLGNCPQQRRPSFSQEPENDGTHVAAAGAAAAALVLGAELGPAPGDIIDALGAEKPELTCISEEGIADMDLPDNLLDDLDYIGDCITSCNKVENYLMLSEFENNLIAEMPIIMDRRGRRWSLARSKAGQTTVCGQQTVGTNAVAGNSPIQEEDSNETNAVKWHLGSQPTNANSRTITVIDEAST